MVGGAIASATYPSANLAIFYPVRVTRAFTPDFYLPEQDLYVEITVMKQSLVTRKNRKLRELRELYPDVKVKLFYRRDIERLAQRYQLRIAS